MKTRLLEHRSDWVALVLQILQEASDPSVIVAGLDGDVTPVSHFSHTAIKYGETLAASAKVAPSQYPCVAIYTLEQSVALEDEAKFVITFKSSL